MSNDVRINRDGSWTMLKEDSRLRHEKELREVQDKIGRWFQPVFCISCGKQDGYAAKSSWTIIVQCEDCFQKYGRLPLPILPSEDEVKWREGRL